MAFVAVNILRKSVIFVKGQHFIKKYSLPQDGETTSYRDLSNLNYHLQIFTQKDDNR